MKTPKRKYKSNFLEYGDETYNLLSPRKKEHLNRWKRKNRIAQLKRTISRLTDELWRERECRMYLHAAYARLAQIARNAKQENLPCTDAEQQTDRKEQA